MEKPSSKIFIIAGPSGVGKSTVISTLLDYFEHAITIPTYTTRPPREDDKQSKSRITITEMEFSEMADRQEFVEFKKVHDWHYGKRKIDFDEASARGKHVILDVDVQGLDDYRKAFPHVHAVFIQYEDLNKLKERIRKNRKDANEADLQIRLESAIKEMGHKHKYDHLVTSHEGYLDKTVNEIIKIIESKLKSKQ